jgi:CRISPR system Cascade subunit CasE
MPADLATLHLVQLALDGRRLHALGRDRRLPSLPADIGYLVHCLLGELFGELAPRPFRIVSDDARGVAVLGHCDADAATLQDHATRFADPSVHAACDWQALATKPFPVEWPAGTRLGFSVRCCPVVRKAADGTHHRKGAEVDAFVSRCWEVERDVPVERASVYAEWLRGQLERRGGARLLEARLGRFRLLDLLRRDHAPRRTAREQRRPDATLEGTLEVTDGPAFLELLRTGIGRHRAFGFGLLLLRRP